jgi:hypothetical protein
MRSGAHALDRIAFLKGESQMKFRAAEHVAWQAVADRVIVVDLRTGSSIGLNETGSVIWQRMNDDPATLAAELVSRFSVATDEAERDIREFIEMLRAKQLIVEEG